MPLLQKPIQAAGVRSVAEARMLAACGVTHVGLPLRLAYHKPDVDDEGAREIVRALSGLAQAVLITYLDQAEDILALCRFLGVDGVQLHAPVTPGQMRRLRQAAPDLLLIKSLIVGAAAETEVLAEAQAHAPHVDAFLTDTFDPATGATGATGKAHDWAVSARLARALPRPLILAGGLGPENVARAIAAVRPAGVDAHTGLENAAGDKDEALVRRFVEQAHRAFAAASGRGAFAGLAKARVSA
jgi:phosphoribosylanthranilate isomerase